MDNSAPKTFDEFAKKYTPRIKSYILAQNNKNSTKLDPDDFIQEVLIKFDREKTLNKYNPEKGASFNTWFNRIIYNFYCTAIRKKGEHDAKFFSMPENQKISNTDTYLKTDTQYILSNKDDRKLILNIIENIPEVRTRLSIKLKAYPLINLNSEDISFIAEKTGLAKNNIKDGLEKMYNKKPGDRPGLKDTDVANLLGFKSFSTQKERAVRKYVIPQYIYMKNRHK